MIYICIKFYICIYTIYLHICLFFYNTFRPHNNIMFKNVYNIYIYKYIYMHHVLYIYYFLFFYLFIYKMIQCTPDHSYVRFLAFYMMQLCIYLSYMCVSILSIYHSIYIYIYKLLPYNSNIIYICVSSVVLIM